MCGCVRCVVVLATLAIASGGVAEDAYFHVPIRDLAVTEGRLPQYPEGGWRGNWQRSGAMQPRAVLDGQGEVYVDPGPEWGPWSPPTQITWQGFLGARVPQKRDLAGRLFLPKEDGSGMVMLRFTVPASQATPEARFSFYAAKQAHYQGLIWAGTPGAAWFRHQAREAQAALHREPRAAPQPPGERFVGPGWDRTTDLAQTYALFTGGRAMSENLQLERVLPETRPDAPTVAIDSIEGITVRQFDWERLTKGLDPMRDPLARLIPADQHAVFFPSLGDAIKVADLLSEHGTVVLRLAEPRSEDARTFQRYERQFCLPLDGLVRLLGPQVARSVALTGSDPYFRTGTDAAVLIETPQPDLVEKLLLAQINLAAAAQDAKGVEGEVEGLSYRGARSPDRSVSSYVAKLEGAVVVANSLHQLGRLAMVYKGQSKPIASLAEYVFFRSRYPVGDREETAFVFLSDATIRRWCGPRWRIATSRRTRDMAVLSELQAAQLDRLATNTVTPGPIYTDLPQAVAGEFTLEAAGVRSSVHGTLGFMTPIAELAMDRVTQAEADGYRRWRDGYQRNWTVSFDPIGMRLCLGEDKLSADVSVMPLIVGTQYRPFIAVSEGATIRPDAGDPHNALAHVILAINRWSPMFAQASNLLTQMAGGITLGWMGDSVAVYADDDQFWRDLAKVPRDKLFDFLQNEGGRIPLAVEVDVSNGIGLVAFLAGARAFIEQSSPGMTVWESLKYNDEPYVKVSPTERAKSRRDVPADLAFYYAASGESLVLTLSESVLKRSLDRRIARRQAAQEGKPLPPVGKPWLGSNLGLQAERSILEIVSTLAAQEYQALMQARAWGNLPILNEWKRLYPDQDPVALHERIWQTRLVCPGGGAYVWNEAWQTMESTVYGHPGEPKQGPGVPPALLRFLRGNFGVSFQDQGLRARVELEQEKEVR